jgi:hypothetical protein
MRIFFLFLIIILFEINKFQIIIKDDNDLRKNKYNQRITVLENIIL